MESTPEQAMNIRRRAARAEASVWIVRLHGPDRNADLEAGFRAWLAADPENGRQFERVTETWDAGASPLAGVARLAPRPRALPSSPARQWLLAAALAFVLIGAGFWTADHFWLNPTYVTGIGEQRIVRLSDGTRITLNSDSRVAISYRDQERRVRIDRGEAFFDVAKDPARPFLVRAGDHQVRALGTSFNVRYERQRTMVTLVEGKVTVSALPERLGADTQEPVPIAETILAPGQRLVVGKSKAPQLDEPPIDVVTAWRRGEVMLDKTVLAEAIAEMNRYDENTLIIDDPAIAGLRISGIYHTADNETFAQMISELYGLEVIHRSGEIHLATAQTSASN